MAIFNSYVSLPDGSLKDSPSEVRILRFFRSWYQAVSVSDIESTGSRHHSMGFQWSITIGKP